jgi:hypothetical protein
MTEGLASFLSRPTCAVGEPDPDEPRQLSKRRKRSLSDLIGGTVPELDDLLLH